MPDEPQVNGVRITTREIYDLLVKVDGRVGRVEQSISDTLRPSLDRHEERISALDREKADRELLAEQRGQIRVLEMRVYAIIGGLVAALFGAKGLGLL